MVGYGTLKIFTHTYCTHKIPFYDWEGFCYNCRNNTKQLISLNPNNMYVCKRSIVCMEADGSEMI